MIETRIPMRWADLDQLNHVNNVVYVDYAEQTRAELIRSGEAFDAPVTRIDVEFRRPLQLSRTPVLVRSRFEGDATVHDIGPDGVDASFATVRLGTGPAVAQQQLGDGPAFDLAIRRSDIGPDGTVTPTRFFEICQEARILAFAALMPDRRPGHIVIARVDVHLGEPVTPDVGVLPTSTAVTRVGRSSYSTTTWFGGGRYGAAEAVLVGFDAETQRSRPLGDEERAALEAALVTD